MPGVIKRQNRSTIVILRQVCQNCVNPVIEQRGMDTQNVIHAERDGCVARMAPACCVNTASRHRSHTGEHLFHVYIAKPKRV